MKQFIVLMAIFPIMIIFILQFSLNQTNNHNIIKLQEIVYASKEMAKQNGCFNSQMEENLRDEIAKTFKINGDDIILELEMDRKYRKNSFDERELINYKVKVPINQIMVAGEFFGISDEDNRGWYVIESFTASEKLE